MAYVGYEYYKSIYGDKALPEADFSRLLWECEKRVNNLTTGVDGVRKLRKAFPEDEDDAEAVRRCICKCVEIAGQIEAAEQRIKDSQATITREDGTISSALVTSRSAGSESMSFATGTGASLGNTLIDSVLADKAAQEKLYVDIVQEYLSGVADANNVNLLYAGVYPARM
jgi:hypothetical protein